MYMLFPTAVALSFLGSFVYAQSNDTALGIPAIEAHFKGALLVPQILPTFTPSAIMNVNYTGVGIIAPGQNLTKAREQTIPSPFLFF
jgi:phosphatidylethanolamine-binding protein